MTKKTLAKTLGINLPSPLQRLEMRSAPGNELALYCKRDDLIHPVISGNKWRKLSGNLQRILQTSGCDGSNEIRNSVHIGSFGGAYSNHLHALAFACFSLGIPCTAFVRTHPNSPPTPTLEDMHRWNCRIHFLSREEYRKRTDINFVNALLKAHSLSHMIEEGGSNSDALSGVGEIVSEVLAQSEQPFDSIVLPVASGGTIAGIIKAIRQRNITAKVIGIAVLKGERYLESMVNNLLDECQTQSSWKILHEPKFHCGGYAKINSEILNFSIEFEQSQGFALDHVYNAKSFFALNQLLMQKSPLLGKRAIILNTGGMQGNRGKIE
ncbi:1-aminocyclopropane-1-carboxylate deaminase/D-cysteine desulfhydrase [Ningiella sp. W23]|uniref:1-aminocyclopropane-1-carboxylate deaminase/D-cysteine desulfhydrase n=1 Tax=Ningiella sp. W23 TaxID=3023715 RepID=UPI0039F5002A